MLDIHTYTYGLYLGWDYLEIYMNDIYLYYDIRLLLVSK